MQDWWHSDTVGTAQLQPEVRVWHCIAYYRLARIFDLQINLQIPIGPVVTDCYIYFFNKVFLLALNSYNWVSYPISIQPSLKFFYHGCFNHLVWNTAAHCFWWGGTVFVVYLINIHFSRSNKLNFRLIGHFWTLPFITHPGSLWPITGLVEGSRGTRFSASKQRTGCWCWPGIGKKETCSKHTALIWTFCAVSEGVGA